MFAGQACGPTFAIHEGIAYSAKPMYIAGCSNVPLHQLLSNRPRLPLQQTLYGL